MNKKLGYFPSSFIQMPSYSPDEGGGGGDDDLDQDLEDPDTVDDDEVEGDDEDKVDDIDDADEGDDAEVDELDDEEESEEKGDEDEEEEEGKKKDDEEGDTDVTVQSLKKAYPDILKKFPDLRNVIYRENAFRQLFPSVKAAEEINGRSEDLAVIEAHLIQDGDAKWFAEVMKARGGENYKKFYKRVIPALFETDRELYREVTQPILQLALHAALSEGKKSGDKNQVIAAKLMSKFLFNTDEISLPDSDDPDLRVQERVNREREEWLTEVSREAVTEIYEASRESLLVDAAEGLPKNLTKWQREKLVEDIADKVDALIQQDPSAVQNLKSLFARARQSRYSRESKARIKSAYLARAKNLLPKVKARLLAQALGTKPSTKGEGTQVKKRFQGQGGGGKPTGRTPNADQIDWDKTSDEDLLAGRPTLKK